eukprot:3197031-Pleurochrysis_carterae.AAC.1
MDRPVGTCERSISVQLPLLAWFAISARSASPHPILSSAMACFRVRGSAVVAEVAKAQPVFRPHCGLLPRARRARSAAPRDRNGRIVGRGRRVGYGRWMWCRRSRRWAWCRRGCRKLTCLGGCVSSLWYGAVQAQVRGDDASEEE